MKSSALTLTTSAGERRTDLVTAAHTARIRTTIVGASTIRVDLPEQALAADLVDVRTATFSGRSSRFVSIRRLPKAVALVYEDSVVAALRAQRDRLMYQVPLAVDEIVGRFASEAGVSADVDPAVGSIVVESVGRSVLEETSSWRELGALAARVGARAYSDGRRLIVATDRTLLAAEATRVTSARGAVTDDILFNLDAAQSHDRAELTVDDTWAVDAGGVVELYGCGPADGRWLVETWTRDIPHLAAGRIRLTRPTTIGA